MKDTIDFSVSDEARTKILKFMEEEDNPNFAIRIGCSREGLKFHYKMALAEDEEPEPEDLILDVDDLNIWIDANSAEHIDGAVLDYVVQGFDGRFKVVNPIEDAALAANPVAAKIKKLIENEINPMVASHGGVIHLIDFKDGNAYVEMGGGCQGCSSAAVTLAQGVREQIVQNIEEVDAVVDTTDHSHGENPYFS
jgi:Fe/S biogenesis protein NfuA